MVGIAGNTAHSLTFFQNLDPQLQPFIPDYEFIFHNLGEIPDEQIETLENKFLYASLLALKYSQLQVELVKWIPTILSLAIGARENLESNLIVYTFEVSGLKEEEIIRIVEEVPVNVKDTVMNTLDIFVEKGKKIGGEEKTEKAVRKMILRGYADAEICDVQEVTPEYVAKIREAIERENTNQ